MMKPKRAIATRYRREEEQAKTSENQISTRRNTGSRVNANKNRKQDVPNPMPDLIDDRTLNMGENNLQNAKSKFRNELLLEHLQLRVKEITELKRKINNLQKDHNDLQKEHNYLQKDHNDLQKDHNDLQKDHNDLQKKHNYLQQDNTDLQKNHNDLQKDYNDLQKNHNDLQKDHNELKEVNDELQEVNNELQEENNKLNKLLKNSQKEIKKLNNENKTFQRKVIILQRHIKKSKLQKEKNERILQETRKLGKDFFNSKIHPNFVTKNSNLINNIVKLYESHSHRDNIQHCPAIQYVKSVPESIISPCHIEDGPPSKKTKMDHFMKDIEKHYSQNSLKELVMNLEPRHSEIYDLWRNVLWSLNKYGSEQEYDTLEIANTFSQRSRKYKNLQDVKRTFESSDGSLSLQYLIEISKIYKEELDEMTEYLRCILPFEYSQLTINEVDIRDRQKFRLNVNSAGESHTLFIIPDLCVLINETGERISFLQKKITSKNPDLASLCPKMEKGYTVTLKNKYYEFQARHNHSATVKLHHPLKAAESFIILPSGKVSKKEEHLAKIRKALRAEAIKLLLTKTGKKFGDDDDDTDMVIIPDEDPEMIRTDYELVEALFNADPDMRSRYWSSRKTIYHCKPDTNLWCELSEKAFDLHLQKNLKTTLKLSKTELSHINMCKGIIKLRNRTLGLIDNSDFHDLLDSNFHLFITMNKTIVTSSMPPIIRNIEKDDLAKTTCGWSYNHELAMKHMQSVQSYFDKLMPERDEREWFLSFVAKMLNGKTMKDFFLVLSDKRGNKNGTSTLMSLLATVFGNYYLANTKIVVAGGIREYNQYDGGIYNLKGKRLLVADQLHKCDTLNGDFIKNITGKFNHHYIHDKNFSRTQYKFPVEAGLIMTFTEDDGPKFDKTDQDFVKRMVALPMRSRFLSQQEIDTLTRKRENMTDIHIADDSLKLNFPEWRSALLDLLIKYYKESLPPIPESMLLCKKGLCDENYDYNDWLDSHVKRQYHAFISAKDVISIIHNSEEFSMNPQAMKKLKLAMSSWAKENGFCYKARHVYRNSQKRRVEAKSVILNAALQNI